MIYLLLGILGIGLVVSLLKGISEFIYNIFTLSFLPNAIGMFDGNVSSYIIPIIGPTLGVVINYVVAVFINIFDFLLWLIYWIPGIRQVIQFVYTSPDMVERFLPWMFGGLSGHRNFITHSVINPVFLVFLMITVILIKSISNMGLRPVVKILCFVIGMSFVCHLLADTMPQAWIGFARIKVYLFTNIFTLPKLLSKLWLYINAFLSFGILFKVTLASEE